MACGSAARQLTTLAMVEVPFAAASPDDPAWVDDVLRGFDRSMTKQERLFVYLPFEHSECSADQDLSVRLIEEFADESWTRYALAHQAAIDRFGRFPFRNAALGRSSLSGRWTPAP
jgi:uncharacterized protein (DUF924 family)